MDINIIVANFLIYILPIRFAAIGILYRIRSKEDINDVSGFRTKLSLKSKENWSYANSYGARLLLLSSLVFFFINILIQIKAKITMDLALSLLSIQVLTFIFVRIETSRSLKKFDKKQKD